MSTAGKTIKTIR